MSRRTAAAAGAAAAAAAAAAMRLAAALLLLLCAEKLSMCPFITTGFGFEKPKKKTTSVFGS